MLGSDIDTEARLIVQDSDPVHWTPAYMLQSINAGMRDIVTHKPKANTRVGLLTLVANSASQTIPDTSIQLLEVLCNMGVNGTTPGRAITLTSVERMNAAKLDWRRDRAQAVRHYMPDDRDPRVFLVWPAPSAAIKVQARTCDQPTAIDDLADPLPIGDEYRNALVEFVMFRLYSQDAEDSENAQLAAAHYGMYANTLGIQVKQLKAMSAGANSTANPAYPAVDKNGA
jgi:hypothetical protein